MAGQVLVSDVVVALVLSEVDQVQVVLVDEAVNGAHEVLRDRLHERARDERHPRYPLKMPTAPEGYASLGW